jgi:hypothetical protein
MLALITISQIKTQIYFIIFLIPGEAPVDKKARNTHHAHPSNDDDYIPASGQYLISLFSENALSNVSTVCMLQK